MFVVMIHFSPFDIHGTERLLPLCAKTTSLHGWVFSIGEISVPGIVTGHQKSSSLRCYAFALSVKIIQHRVQLIRSKAENNDGDQSPTKPALKKRARANQVTEDEGEEVADEPAPKKTKAGARRGKKVEVAENEADTEEEVPVPTKKAKGDSKKKTVATAKADANEEDPAIQKRGGANGKATAAKKPKAPKKAAEAAKAKLEEGNVDGGEGSEGSPKAKRGRKKAGDGSKTGVSNTTTKSRGKKAGAENVCPALLSIYIMLTIPTGGR